MRLIKSNQHADGSVNFYLPAGRYAGLIVRLAGTNAGGATLGVTELGTLKISHYNNEIINIAPDHLLNLTNLYGGVAESASAVGAAYTYTFVVPFRKKNDRNNALVVTANQTSFVLNGFNTAKVAAGTIEVYAIFSDAPASYVPVIKGVDIPISAASTFIYDLPQKNIAEVFILTDVHLLRAQVTKDGSTIVDGTWAAIVAASNAFNWVETAITLVEVFAPKSDQLKEVQNNQVKLQLTTDAAIAPLRTVYVAVILPGQ